MRILIVNTLYTPYQIGGAEKSVQALAELLVKRNHNVAILTLGENNDYTRIANVRVFRFKVKNIYWPFNANPNSFQKLRWHLKDTYNKSYDEDIHKVFKEFRPQIIHTHNLGGFSVRVWDLAQKSKIPVFHTLRDYYLMSTSTTNLEGENPLDKIFSKKRKETSQKVDFVSGISEFILEQHLHKNYFKNAKSKVIYNGFDFRKEKRLKTPTNPIKFGFIGQVKEHKGINLLLQTFIKLKTPNTRLLIAGKAEDELIHSYQNDPRIEFKGFMNAQDFFQEIDVLVVPSLWHEPFGRVVMEALVYHKAVIASKMGGIPELLKNNPEFLFEPREKDLLDLMGKIVSDPKFLNNFQISSGFLEEFSLDSMVNQYEAVYKTLILRANEN